MEPHSKTQEILQRLRDGESLNAICKDDDMPTESTVRGWVARDYMGFADPYRKAREIGYERLADEILAISDEVSVEAKHQGEDVVLDVSGTSVARNRLRVDTRKWLLSKMLPKVFGDKLDLNANVKSSVNIVATPHDEAL